MGPLVIRHFFQFLLFVTLQIVVFNNIFFIGYINPYIYLMFLILLPINKSKKNMYLVIGFLTGLIIDAFENSMGLHAFSCVLLMYVKEPLLLYFVPQLKNKSQQIIPFSLNEYGIPITIFYTCSLVFIHHFTLFLIEAFRFDLLNILLRTFSSGLVTSVLLIIFHFFNSRNSIK